MNVQRDNFDIKGLSPLLPTKLNVEMKYLMTLTDLCFNNFKRNRHKSSEEGEKRDDDEMRQKTILFGINSPAHD